MKGCAETSSLPLSREKPISRATWELDKGRAEMGARRGSELIRVQLPTYPHLPTSRYTQSAALMSTTMG